MLTRRAPSSTGLYSRHRAGISGLALAASHPALQTSCQHQSNEIMPYVEGT